MASPLRNTVQSLLLHQQQQHQHQSAISAASFLTSKVGTHPGNTNSDMFYLVNNKATMESPQQEQFPVNAFMDDSSPNGSSFHPRNGGNFHQRRTSAPNTGIKSSVKCNICSKEFNNSSALAKHRLTHTEERKYVCEKCNKAFKRQDHLSGHRMTHEEEKPHKCMVDGCGKSYCDTRSLKRHYENVHHFHANESPVVNEGGRLPQTEDPSPQSIDENEALERKHSTASAVFNRSETNSPLNLSRVGNMHASNEVTPSEYKKDLHHQRSFSLYSGSELNGDSGLKPNTQCMTCHKKFKSPAALNGHMRLHGGYANLRREAPPIKSVGGSVSPPASTCVFASPLSAASASPAGAQGHLHGNNNNIGNQVHDSTDIPVFGAIKHSVQNTYSARTLSLSTTLPVGTCPPPLIIPKQNSPGSKKRSQSVVSHKADLHFPAGLIKQELPAALNATNSLVSKLPLMQGNNAGSLGFPSASVRHPISHNVNPNPTPNPFDVTKFAQHLYTNGNMRQLIHQQQAMQMAAQLRLAQQNDTGQTPTPSNLLASQNYFPMLNPLSQLGFQNSNNTVNSPANLTNMGGAQNPQDSLPSCPPSAGYIDVVNSTPLPQNSPYGPSKFQFPPPPPPTVPQSPRPMPQNLANTPPQPSRPMSRSLVVPANEYPAYDESADDVDSLHPSIYSDAPTVSQNGHPCMLAPPPSAPPVWHHHDKSRQTSHFDFGIPPYQPGFDERKRHHSANLIEPCSAPPIPHSWDISSMQHHQHHSTHHAHHYPLQHRPSNLRWEPLHEKPPFLSQMPCVTTVAASSSASVAPSYHNDTTQSKTRLSTISSSGDLETPPVSGRPLTPPTADPANNSVFTLSTPIQTSASPLNTSTPREGAPLPTQGTPQSNLKDDKPTVAAIVTSVVVANDISATTSSFKPPDAVSKKRRPPALSIPAALDNFHRFSGSSSPSPSPVTSATIQSSAPIRVPLYTPPPMLRAEYHQTPRTPRSFANLVEDSGPLPQGRINVGRRYQVDLETAFIAPSPKTKRRCQEVFKEQLVFDPSQCIGGFSAANATQRETQFNEFIGNISPQNLELALHTLHQANGDTDVASRLMSNEHPSLPASLKNYSYPHLKEWSAEESTRFTNALTTVKDFRYIASKVKTKSMKDCVEFYYTFKKKNFNCSKIDESLSNASNPSVVSQDAEKGGRSERESLKRKLSIMNGNSCKKASPSSSMNDSGLANSLEKSNSLSNTISNNSPGNSSNNNNNGSNNPQALEVSG